MRYEYHLRRMSDRAFHAGLTDRPPEPAAVVPQTSHLITSDERLPLQELADLIEDADVAESEDEVVEVVESGSETVVAVVSEEMALPFLIDISGNQWFGPQLRSTVSPEASEEYARRTVSSFRDRMTKNRKKIQ